MLTARPMPPPRRTHPTASMDLAYSHGIRSQRATFASARASPRRSAWSPSPLPSCAARLTFEVTRAAGSARQRLMLLLDRVLFPSFVNLGAKHVGVFTDPTVANLPVMKVVRPQHARSAGP